MEVMLLGEPLTARRACEVGFVNQVVPKGPAELAGAARRQAEVVAGSADLAEGLAAFRDKRPPVFRGS